MSSIEDHIRNLVTRLGLLFRSQFILVYIVGFKRLFYQQRELDSKKRISIIKLTLFIVYIAAYIFSSLQFAEVNIPATVREEWSHKENIELMEMFPLSIYGELAHLMHAIIFLAFFYFLVTQDKPVTELLHSIKDFASQSKTHTIGVFILLSFSVFWVFLQVLDFILFPEALRVTIIALSYEAGIGLFIAWVVLQPILVFSALLLTFDMIAKDRPEPFKGYNRKNITLFVVCLVIVVIFVGIFSPIFNIELEEINSFIPIPGLENMFYSQMGVYFMLIGVIITTFIMVCLIITELIIKRLKRSSKIQDHRMANFLFLFPFILIYVLLKAFPAAFAFSSELKTLNSILDLISLFFVLFFAIFRVLAVRETERKDLILKDYLNPKRWVQIIPTYGKVLALSYLAFASFYVGLEANTAFALSGATSMFKEIRMYSSIGLTFFAMVYVFWRYKLDDLPTSEDSINA